MPARRLAALAAPWILVLGLTRGVVALPERCPPATAEQARAAAVEAVGWFERNQRDDGHWVYRYDRDADEVNRQDHVVRQAGITLSLYQAHAAGIPGALEPADEGVEWLLGELVRHDDWAAVERAGLAPTGGTALLVAALSTRRAATDDPRFDTELDELGQFLVAMTEPSGAVVANWDAAAERPVRGDYSPFFTGETYFALALLATVDPAGDWGPTADRIGGYLPERDDVEDRFPPITDHWGAYGLAQMALDADRPLAASESAYAERLAGLFSVEVRFESQRTGEGLVQLLRGPQIVGAGLGTIGEGLGSLWRLSDVDDGLAGDRTAISERLRCVAGMLVDRQVTAAEAAESGHPGLARGAWFYKDLTQMDDQQHSLSALLLAEPALADEGAAAGGAASSDDDVSTWRAIWLAVIALAAVNPLRVRRVVGRIPAATAVAGSIAAGGVIALVAAAGGPMLRALDVSPATGLIGAGLVVALLGVIDAVRRPGGPFPAAGPGDGLLAPLLVPALLRPSVALLALAVTADAGWVAGAGVAVAVAAAGAMALLLSPAGDDRPAWVAALGEAARWGLAAVAIVGGIDLAVHGVLGV